LISPWIIVQLVILVSLGGILLIALGNLAVLRRMSQYPLAQHLPRVSVMVPARNEERNIALCLESLLNQDYPDFEVLVLDDASEDRTGAIISALTQRYPQLRVIKGKPLPHGWIGKHWACQQLGQAAKGELLLFTDADTHHGPQSLRHSVSTLSALHADLLTAVPQEIVLTWAEKLTVPIIPWSILCFLPLPIAYLIKAPALSSSIGQFMLLRRPAYLAVGGYESVRQDVVDDIALGKRIKAAGYRWRVANALGDVQCRMYHNAREVIGGLGKSVYASLGLSLTGFALAWSWMAGVFVVPVVMLVLALFGAAGDLSLTYTLVSVVIGVILWAIAHWRFGFPWYLTLAYPATVFFAYCIALYSMFLSVSGKAVWKGRALLRPKPRFF
jgi:chlorobactene glucosyltransferase